MCDGGNFVTMGCVLGDSYLYGRCSIQTTVTPQSHWNQLLHGNCALYRPHIWSWYDAKQWHNVFACFRSWIGYTCQLVTHWRSLRPSCLPTSSNNLLRSELKTCNNMDNTSALHLDTRSLPFLSPGGSTTTTHLSHDLSQPFRTHFTEACFVCLVWWRCCSKYSWYIVHQN